jgi:hypothetical protein
VRGDRPVECVAEAKVPRKPRLCTVQAENRDRSSLVPLPGYKLKI